MSETPPWLLAARKDYGIREIPGRKHHPEIIHMLDQADGKLDGKNLQGISDDETPWCSTAMCAWMEEAGIKSTRSAMARSWNRWGIALRDAAVGAIVVFWRGSRNGSLGHVGIVEGRDRAGHLIVLGGNQSNAVTRAAFGRERVLSYRWPDDYSIPTVGFSALPVVGTRPVSTNEA